MADRQARGSSQSSARSPFKTCLAQCNRRQCAVLCSSRATVATGECSIAIITPNSPPIMHDVLLVNMTTRSSIMLTAGGCHFVNTTVGSNRCPQLRIAGAACWHRISKETLFRHCRYRGHLLDSSSCCHAQSRRFSALLVGKASCAYALMCRVQSDVPRNPILDTHAVQLDHPASNSYRTSVRPSLQGCVLCPGPPA
jgi:hypothetical protein